jgi:mRNA interferase HicA
VKRAAPASAFGRYGCYLKREGGVHSLWCNAATGAVESVPRHGEIANRLAADLSRPFRS